MTAQAKIASERMPATASNHPAFAQAAQGTMSVVDLINAAQDLAAAGQAQTAVALYRLWQEKTVSPLAYAVCFNLAVLLADAHDDVGAEHAYRASIEHNPNFVEARLNLGTLLERVGRPEQALAEWNAILTTVQPPVSNNEALYLQTINNLGRLLEITKQYPAAEEMLALSLKVNPDQPKVMSHWVHLRQKQCEWPVFSGLDHISLETMMRGTSALAMLSASADPAEQLAASRRFVEEKVLCDVEPLTGQYGYAHQRLRIGYLSSDFVSHAVSILTAELYELHDREKVEVYAFCWSREDGSPIRARVIGAMDHHIRIGAMSDEEAARCIRSHEIDILVDLHGLTLGARPNILSYRPAPVQVTYLGFPGTTALPSIDYVLADKFVLPPATAAFFTEKPLYLPDTFQVNDRQRLIGPRPDKASCQLPEDAFVFCSFNNNFKFTPEVFALWMRILRRTPGSVLWLVADGEVVRENLCRAAERDGVERARLIFAARALPADYLARFQLADLFLDTFPFGAGTTASDALWAGLPLLTCAGAVFASRMAGSLLRAVDLPELVTDNFADYEELAVALAGQPEKIAAMKRQLDANRMSCALFDSPRLVRNLEAALQSVAKAPAPNALAAPTPTPAAAQPDNRSPDGSVMGLPKVSIVIPTYKPEHFEQCLRSALGQTYPNIEILVSDNCPTEAIKDICAKFNGVIYQRNSVVRDQNCISAFYSGKGTYIKPLFDDDILHPFCIERMVATMMAHPDVELVFSASHVIDANNQRVEARRPYQDSGSMSGIDLQRAMALGMRNFVGEFSSIMCRRARLWHLGWHRLFDIGGHDFIPGLADVAAYCNLAREGTAFYIDEELSYFRRDARLQSNSNPQSNPNLGYCFSDYIDLLVASHVTAVISADELLGMGTAVDNVKVQYGGIFPQVGQAHQRYLDYTAKLRLS